MARLSFLVFFACLAVTAVFGNPRPEPEEVLNYAVSVAGTRAHAAECPATFDALPPLNLLCRERTEADAGFFEENGPPEEVAVNRMTFNGQSESIYVERFEKHRDVYTTTHDAPRA